MCRVTSSSGRGLLTDTLPLLIISLECIHKIHTEHNKLLTISQFPWKQNILYLEYVCRTLKELHCSCISISQALSLVIISCKVEEQKILIFSSPQIHPSHSKANGSLEISVNPPPPFCVTFWLIFQQMYLPELVHRYICQNIDKYFQQKKKKKKADYVISMTTCMRVYDPIIWYLPGYATNAIEHIEDGLHSTHSLKSQNVRSWNHYVSI